MRLTTLALAAILAPAAAVSLAQAQYNQGPQPYNAQDPNNYGAPAAQNYNQAYPQQQQGYPQQQQAYPQQQPYPQQPPYPQQQGAADQRYDPNAYAQQNQGQYQGAPQPYGQSGGQEQIYQAPPALPDYDQPPAPGEGDIWTPGYWAFGPAGYYWVPGAWVPAPYDGALWTPGYWGYGGSGYFWNAGYWGNEVGFYGGINYGFGYFGTGFYGGYWRDHRFWYNREYAHFGGGIHNFYSQRVEGVGGIRAGGRSFTNASAPRGSEFRGGSYNNAARGFAGSNGTVSRGYASPGQGSLGRPATPGSSYSGMNRGSYAAPVYNAPAQRSYQPAATARPQTFSGAGSYSRPAAQQQHYAAPSGGGNHYSAPSGGGHASTPSGGGSHASAGGGGHAGGGHR